MKEITVPDYKSFFNLQAINLVKFSLQVNSRVKASRIFKTACRMEKRWRKYHGVRDDTTVLYGGCIEKATPLWMIRNTEHTPLHLPRGGSAIDAK